MCCTVMKNSDIPYGFWAKRVGSMAGTVAVMRLLDMKEVCYLASVGSGTVDLGMLSAALGVR